MPRHFSSLLLCILYHKKKKNKSFLVKMTKNRKIRRFAQDFGVETQQIHKNGSVNCLNFFDAVQSQPAWNAQAVLCGMNFACHSRTNNKIILIQKQIYDHFFKNR